MSNTPEYLYHYTTVETLAMILKKKKISFSPLTILDDMQEEKAKDKEKYAKFVFISSWTEEADENIPMWEMYSNLYSGVRIKLPIYPFEECVYDFNEFMKMVPNAPVEKCSDISLIVPSQELTKPYFMVPFHKKESLLWKVIYTENQEELEPQVKQKIEGKFIYNLPQLGRHKNIYWTFQKEWRYILYFNPISLQELKSQFAFQIASERFSDEKYSLPFKHYFLKLDENSFSKMEITLSPKISDGNRTIVELLKERLNPTMGIYESELYNKIR
jgi:hypothetical protein